MKNKKFLMIGLILLLIIGLVSVFVSGTQNKSSYGHYGWKNGGGCNYNNVDKSAWLEKLGLTSDATDEEIIEAKKELFGQHKTNHWVNIKEKLGLSDDASDEEVEDALQKWKEGNNFHWKKGYKHS